MADKWRYWKKGEERGPIPERVLRELAVVGELQTTDYVAREGTAERLPAANVVGLFPAPTKTPPQPPGTQ